MKTTQEPKLRIREDRMRDFLVEIMKIGFNAIIKFVIAFAIGTGAGAIVCWYYSIPLVFSILGGILVLGVALALMSDTMFD